jgi:hypothetical protein
MPQVVVPEFYKPYLSSLPADDIIESLLYTSEDTLKLFGNLDEELANFAYAPGKWTTKQVLRHVIDCELIFAYRALRFARFDQTKLNAFDENAYISGAGILKQDLSEMLKEYDLLRKMNISMFNTFSDDSLNNEGFVENNVFTTAGVGLIIAGHNLHHNNIIRLRYLK